MLARCDSYRPLPPFFVPQGPGRGVVRELGAAGRHRAAVDQRREIAEGQPSDELRLPCGGTRAVSLHAFHVTCPSIRSRAFWSFVPVRRTYAFTITAAIVTLASCSNRHDSRCSLPFVAPSHICIEGAQKGCLQSSAESRKPEGPFSDKPCCDALTESKQVWQEQAAVVSSVRVALRAPLPWCAEGSPLTVRFPKVGQEWSGQGVLSA